MGNVSLQMDLVRDTGRYLVASQDGLEFWFDKQLEQNWTVKDMQLFITISAKKWDRRMKTVRIVEPAVPTTAKKCLCCKTPFQAEKKPVCLLAMQIHARVAHGRHGVHELRVQMEELIEELQALVKASKEHERPKFKALPNKWIARSAYQKLIRRGQVEEAMIAGMNLLHADPVGLWRAFSTIIVEDVGITDLDLLSWSTMCGLVTLQKKAGLTPIDLLWAFDQACVSGADQDQVSLRAVARLGQVAPGGLEGLAQYDRCRAAGGPGRGGTWDGGQVRSGLCAEGSQP